MSSVCFAKKIPFNRTMTPAPDDAPQPAFAFKTWCYGSGGWLLFAVQGDACLPLEMGSAL
jgi:hypothetical protein